MRLTRAELQAALHSINECLAGVPSWIEVDSAKAKTEYAADRVEQRLRGDAERAADKIRRELARREAKKTGGV